MPDEKQKFLMGDFEYVDKIIEDKWRTWMNDMNTLRTFNANKQNWWSNIETIILKNCRIVCATLSMAGIEKVFNMGFKYSYLIIDEAC